MSEALEVFAKVIDTDCPSNALHEWSKTNFSEDRIVHDFATETTTYIFDDGSEIIDWKGNLSVEVGSE